MTRNFKTIINLMTENENENENINLNSTSFWMRQ